MEFPIAGITVSPLLLAGIGFMVGILGGFFGVGGGFIAGPMMLLLGIPANFVVGTDLAHRTGKSIVAARRHRALGHIDIKLGAIMVAGTLVGVELGARRIEMLEAAGTVDRLHEPYRASAYPELPELIEAALAAGAKGACMSGAGPTVIAFSDDVAAAATIAAAMERRAQSLGMSGRAAVQSVRAEGARVMREGDVRPEGASRPLA